MGAARGASAIVCIFSLLWFACGDEMSQEGEHEYKTVRSEFVVQVVFVGVVVGAFNTHVLTRISLQIPYTVALFVEGMLLALLMKKYPMGKFGVAADAWGDVDPELLLFIFLPVLIFGEAMTLNWHQVQTTFWQCFLLAVPGVVISTALTAAITAVLLPAWDWKLCFVFGSIVSATDPVAVVSILKNAGASPKLTTLIIGESLMNDGTAMIFFSLFYGMVEGKTYSAEDIMIYFLKMAVGSPLVGCVFGLFFVMLTGQANRQLSSSDVTVQISLTLCCAYMVFFVAQVVLEISGVISCCGAGLMFSWLSPPLILQPETMHSVWSMLEWVANTILFLLSGFILGSDIFYHIEWTDFVYVIVFYAALQVVRLVVVFVLFPVLSRVGQKCSVPEAVFMTWSGLRGALGMSLALIVKENKNEHIKIMQADRLFFYVGGVAALSLIVNATSARKVLQLLGILRNSSGDDLGSNRQMVIDLIKVGLRRKMKLKMASLLEEVPTASGSDVSSYIGLLVEEGAEEASPTSSSSSGPDCRTEALKLFSSRPHVLAPLQDVLQYVRSIFLGIVRVEYWRGIESGKMPREATFTNFLLYSVDSALDRVHMTGLQDWPSLCTDMTISPATLSLLNVVETFENKLSGLLPPYGFRALYFARNAEMRAYLLTNFIEAQVSAQEKVCRFMGQPADTVTPEEQTVIAESVQSVSEARKMLNELDKTVVGSITSKQTARALLKHQTDLVLGMEREGLLTPSDASGFLYSIAEDMTRVDKETKRILKRQRKVRHSDGIESTRRMDDKITGDRQEEGVTSALIRLEMETSDHSSNPGAFFL